MIDSWAPVATVLLTIQLTVQAVLVDRVTLGA